MVGSLVLAPLDLGSRGGSPNVEFVFGGAALDLDKAGSFAIVPGSRVRTPAITYDVKSRLFGESVFDVTALHGARLSCNVGATNLRLGAGTPFNFSALAIRKLSSANRIDVSVPSVSGVLAGTRLTLARSRSGWSAIKIASNHQDDVITGLAFNVGASSGSAVLTAEHADVQLQLDSASFSVGDGMIETDGATGTLHLDASRWTEVAVTTVGTVKTFAGNLQGGTMDFGLAGNYALRSGTVQTPQVMIDGTRQPAVSTVLSGSVSDSSGSITLDNTNKLNGIAAFGFAGYTSSDGTSAGAVLTNETIVLSSSLLSIPGGTQLNVNGGQASAPTLSYAPNIPVPTGAIAASIVIASGTLSLFNSGTLGLDPVNRIMVAIVPNVPSAQWSMTGHITLLSGTINTSDNSFRVLNGTVEGADFASVGGAPLIGGADHIHLVLDSMRLKLKRSSFLDLARGTLVDGDALKFDLTGSKIPTMTIQARVVAGVATIHDSNIAVGSSTLVVIGTLDPSLQPTWTVRGHVTLTDGLIRYQKASLQLGAGSADVDMRQLPDATQGTISNVAVELGKNLVISDRSMFTIAPGGAFTSSQLLFADDESMPTGAFAVSRAVITGGSLDLGARGVITLADGPASKIMLAGERAKGKSGTVRMTGSVVTGVSRIVSGAFTATTKSGTSIDIPRKALRKPTESAPPLTFDLTTGAILGAASVELHGGFSSFGTTDGSLYISNGTMQIPLTFAGDDVFVFNGVISGTRAVAPTGGSPLPPFDVGMSLSINTYNASLVGTTLDGDLTTTISPGLTWSDNTNHAGECTESHDQYRNYRIYYTPKIDSPISIPVHVSIAPDGSIVKGPSRGGFTFALHVDVPDGKGGEHNSGDCNNYTHDHEFDGGQHWYEGGRDVFYDSTFGPFGWVKGCEAHVYIRERWYSVQGSFDLDSTNHVLRLTNFGFRDFNIDNDVNFVGCGPDRTIGNVTGLFNANDKIMGVLNAALAKFSYDLPV
jgi:hypothetical protein